ncbi:hypothetical protein LCGC14_2615610 [marine sediment metagenome]|uniref:Uncharacterized protein n=1 Tax=marine sediment metagenome TaxID=412755 RepID=A0A0F9A4J3_9ZZZZ
MYTLVATILLIVGGLPVSVAPLNVPNLATKIDCINARIELSSRFSDDGVTVSTMCIKTVPHLRH